MGETNTFIVITPSSYKNDREIERQSDRVQTHYKD